MTLQGYVNTDEQGQITKRRIQTVYTVRSGEEPQTCTTNSVSTFTNHSTAITVDMPDLSSYKIQGDRTGCRDHRKKKQPFMLRLI